MTKSTALKSLERTLSSVDEQIFSVEEQAALISIFERATRKQTIDVKREEHFELYADLVALRTSVGNRINLANREVSKLLEAHIKREKAAGSKVYGVDRARAALYADVEATGWVTLLEEGELVAGCINSLLEGFKQRSYAIHEESIENRKSMELASTDR